MFSHLCPVLFILISLPSLPPHPNLFFIQHFEIRIAYLSNKGSLTVFSNSEYESVDIAIYLFRMSEAEFGHIIGK